MQRQRCQCFDALTHTAYALIIASVTLERTHTIFSPCHVAQAMATLILFWALFIALSKADLSYRSDGPNVEYKSLLRKWEKTPFVLHDGSWYRDMLTIEASKAVGKYARKYDYQPQQYYDKVR